MHLSEAQRDALSELLNISFARAANALAELTGDRVVLESPKVRVHLISELRPLLGSILSGPIATIQQPFDGPMAGDALLMLDYEGALLLKSLLLEEFEPLPRLDPAAHEVLVEVGNILLNSCLGEIGNLLQLHVMFAVPKLQVNTLSETLETVTNGYQDLRYGLLVHTCFQVEASSIKGYLVIILSVASLDRLIEAVSTWEQAA